MIYHHLTSPEIAQIANRTIAVLPIAATEQHGPHLPVVTDTALITEIGQRAHAVMEDQIVLLPTLWVGSSHHHSGFPGTLSLSSETYIQLLQELGESLLKAGFQKIVFLNGHGGNITALAEAIHRLALAQRTSLPWIVGATYWLLGSSAEVQTFMETPKLTHAGEYETSMMLALRLDGIRMDLAKNGQIEPWSKFYDPAGRSSSVITISEDFSEITTNGTRGHPEKATAEKGERLLAHYSQLLADFLTDFTQWPERNTIQTIPKK